eukprot:TRINITY_DN23412_c0_g1_i1.p1 TRINITY_DN23412_c0_g1~~TRINITY_DN23412_c0_g1_i1.p1  ORF type:complete len:166 (+),score=32.73 TRINITY_DN23412_c0_g1_i1:464-961(+)
MYNTVCIGLHLQAIASNRGRGGMHCAPLLTHQANSIPMDLCWLTNVADRSLTRYVHPHTEATHNASIGQKHPSPSESSDSSLLHLRSSQLSGPDQLTLVNVCLALVLPRHSRTQHQPECLEHHLSFVRFSLTHNTLSLIHISEPTRLLSISYAVFCLKKKKKKKK